MIRINFDCINDFENEYWLTLNPRVNKGNKRERYAEKSLANNVMKASVKNGPIAKFFKLLCNDEFLLLRKIVLCKPHEFDNLIIRFDIILKSIGIGPLYEVKKGKVSTTKFGSEIMDVFGYENTSKYIEDSKQLILDSINHKICPYCNIQLSENIPKKGRRKNLKDYWAFDLDHYYSKSKYPYLSMSLYNLIPSCKLCNQSLKGTKEFTVRSHLNPHIDDYHKEYKFDIDLTEVLSDLDKIEKIGRDIVNNPTEFENNFNKYKDKIEVNIIRRNNKALDARVRSFNRDLRIYDRYESQKKYVAYYIYLFRQLNSSEKNMYKHYFSEWKSKIPDNKEFNDLNKYNMLLSEKAITHTSYAKYRLDIQDSIFQNLDELNEDDLYFYFE